MENDAVHVADTKLTLPVLVQDMSYAGLPIADGDCAAAAFARLASGMCDATEIKQTRSDLLAYCKQDTLGMVRLHEKLSEMLPT